MSINKTLMLIEDDLDTKELVEAFFKQQGYKIECYDNSEDALARFDLDSEKYSVVISDYKLPDMSGIEFTKKMRELGHYVPIIIMTSSRTIDVALSAIDAGAYDFVVKPVHFPQLLLCVQRALHLNQIKNENSVLKTVIQIKDSSDFGGIIAKSDSLKKVLDLAKRVSTSNANIFITGESGTGKEVIAKMIHNEGKGKKTPFVAINCSAIPENLLESELFGHAKGAFTGAADKKIGLFEEAEGGTLFLDEIGDLSLPLQAKLLRVIQERKIRRLGENTFRAINVRIISATHKNIKQHVIEQKFREDLYFRLNVIPIRIPPLRERKEDILPLAEFFLKKFVALNASKAKGFTKAALDRLLNMKWAGNVRELENTIERAVVLANDSLIDEPELESFMQTDLASQENTSNIASHELEIVSGVNLDHVLTLDQISKKYIYHVFNLNNGAREKTAKDLNIDRKTLYRKLQEIQSESWYEKQ
jgi:two-component system response regulator HydG